ncbi:restriction endonuclease subunit S [Streptococcus suis]|uniref:restriction endonuclease subunit S n=1 Tax=Streptococcus suis TaxID=1307 RepID=UPI000CF429D4|nr:restriction endonuclease subunit S [Streptococcus suis]
MKLEELALFTGGSLQVRLDALSSVDVREYTLYNQQHHQLDGYEVIEETVDSRTVRTDREVTLLKEGDLLFSLLSGKAVLVRAEHAGFLYTQNYIKIDPIAQLDKAFLLYLINESSDIRRQFYQSLQGSEVLKYTVKQLKSLQLGPLPDLEMQVRLGRVYLDGLALRHKRHSYAQGDFSRLTHLIKEVYTHE